jgi:uncharacterized protein (TIGR03435 family)
MTRYKLILGPLTLLVAQVPAQTTSKALAFEVVSVRPLPAPPAGGVKAVGVGLRVINGRATMDAVPLRMIIETAFGVKRYQLIGPEWLDNERFDVIAKVPEGATREQAPAMLETMLKERFHLVAHRETRALPVYDLVVAKPGKMERVTFDPVDWKPAKISNREGHHIVGPMLPSGILRWISLYADRPILDKMGLDEVYYKINLHWSDGARSYDLPSLFTALEEDLGLKLEPRKEPTELIVVDKVDKVPTEN